MCTLFFAAAIAAMELKVGPAEEAKTPEAAVERVRELRREGKIGPTDPVVLRFAPGFYPLARTLTLTPDDSELTFLAEKPGTVVFDGARPLGPFVRTADGVLAAEVPEGFVFEQLWVNGERAVRARTPDRGYLYMRAPYDQAPYSTFHAFANDVAALAGLSDAELHRATVVYWQSWDMGYAPVVSLAGDRVEIARGARNWTLFKWDRTCPRYRLENYRAALTAPGEWFLDRAASKLLYIPRPGEESAALRAMAPALETLVALEGDAENGRYVRNVVFDGIRLEHTALAVSERGIENGQSAWNVKATALRVAGAEGFVFRNGAVAHTGGHAVWLRSGTRKSSIVHSLVEDCGAGGVYFGDMSARYDRRELNGSELTLKDCIVRHGGRIVNGGVGVWLGQVRDSSVVHNEICDFLYTGVSVGWNWGYHETVTRDNHVDFNHVHHIQQGVLSDGGCIYTLGDQEGMTVCNNWVHDIHGYRDNGSPAWGLYTDEGSHGILLASNLVERCRSGAIHQHYGKENTFANNLFVDFEDYGAWRTRAEKHVSARILNNVFCWARSASGVYSCGDGGAGSVGDLRIDGNVYWCREGEIGATAFNGAGWEAWTAGGCDRNGCVADPLFVDAAKGDWRLQPESPALARGFVPFDWTQAGVLKDDPEWVRKASERTWDDFEDAPKAPRYRRETARFTCEGQALGPVRNGLRGYVTLTIDGATDGALEVVPRAEGDSRPVLKIKEVDGLKAEFCPYLYYRCGILDGTARMAFRIKCGDGGEIVAEARDYGDSGKYATGALLRIKDGAVFAADRRLGELKSDVWTTVVVEIPFPSGAWRCTVTPEGGESWAAEVPRSGDGKFSELTWFGLISLGAPGSEWCLDEFSLDKIPDM